ncbi:TIGR03758 family integrating conjugative element protein [Escherichia coli]|uniref:TIGR03758 family integrating conjugative element protein n=1 Tax=Escherichia coli TaxID=562 RepID=UPI000F426A08|nr:TIGR03758 family integrating conjugative element protein [Escherichia coli]RNI70422.1 TIGR03758 family integrating conjugative element protein [Escherichia coli]
MAMTALQNTAFRAASGEVDLSVLHLITLGFLLAVVFLWAAWSLTDAWAGWRSSDVRDGVFGWFMFRLVLLLICSIWMFAG